MKIIWKIYFWIYTIFSSLGITFIVLGKSSVPFSNRAIIDIIAVTIAVVSLYSYAYKKAVFRKRKYWILSLLIVLANVIIQYNSLEILTTVPGLLTFLIAEVPVLYVLFKISFDPRLAFSKFPA